MRTAGEGGEPFSQSVFPSLPRYLLLLLPNQPGGNKRLKQYDARGGGKVDAADFAFDGDADILESIQELEYFRRVLFPSHRVSSEAAAQALKETLALEIPRIGA